MCKYVFVLLLLLIFMRLFLLVNRSRRRYFRLLLRISFYNIGISVRCGKMIAGVGRGEFFVAVCNTNQFRLRLRGFLGVAAVGSCGVKTAAGGFLLDVGILPFGGIYLRRKINLLLNARR